MKFLINVIDNQSGSATGDEMEAISAFNNRLKANNQLLNAWGLESPDQALVIDNRQDAKQISEGSFVTTDEYFSGLWVIEAGSKAEALDLAIEASKCCNRKVELRAML